MAISSSGPSEASPGEVRGAFDEIRKANRVEHVLFCTFTSPYFPSLVLVRPSSLDVYDLGRHDHPGRFGACKHRASDLTEEAHAEAKEVGETGETTFYSRDAFQTAAPYSNGSDYTNGAHQGRNSRTNPSQEFSSSSSPASIHSSSSSSSPLRLRCSVPLKEVPLAVSVLPNVIPFPTQSSSSYQGRNSMKSAPDGIKPSPVNSSPSQSSSSADRPSIEHTTLACGALVNQDGDYVAPPPVGLSHGLPNTLGEEEPQCTDTSPHPIFYTHGSHAQCSSPPHHESPIGLHSSSSSSPTPSSSFVVDSHKIKRSSDNKRGEDLSHSSSLCSALLLIFPNYSVTTCTYDPLLNTIRTTSLHSFRRQLEPLAAPFTQFFVDLYLPPVGQQSREREGKRDGRGLTFMSGNLTGGYPPSHSYHGGLGNSLSSAVASSSFLSQSSFPSSSSSSLQYRPSHLLHHPLYSPYQLSSCMMPSPPQYGTIGEMPGGEEEEEEDEGEGNEKDRKGKGLSCFQEGGTKREVASASSVYPSLSSSPYRHALKDHHGEEGSYPTLGGEQEEGEGKYVQLSHMPFEWAKLWTQVCVFDLDEALNPTSISSTPSHGKDPMDRSLSQQPGNHHFRQHHLPMGRQGGGDSRLVVLSIDPIHLVILQLSFRRSFLRRPRGRPSSSFHPYYGSSSSSFSSLFKNTSSQGQDVYGNVSSKEEKKKKSACRKSKTEREVSMEDLSSAEEGGRVENGSSSLRQKEDGRRSEDEEEEEESVNDDGWIERGEGGDISIGEENEDPLSVSLDWDGDGPSSSEVDQHPSSHISLSPIPSIPATPLSSSFTSLSSSPQSSAYLTVVQPSPMITVPTDSSYPTPAYSTTHASHHLSSSCSPSWNPSCLPSVSSCSPFFSHYLSPFPSKVKQPDGSRHPHTSPYIPPSSFSPSCPASLFVARDEQEEEEELSSFLSAEEANALAQWIWGDHHVLTGGVQVDNCWYISLLEDLPVTQANETITLTRSSRHTKNPSTSPHGMKASSNLSSSSSKTGKLSQQQQMYHPSLSPHTNFSLLSASQQQQYHMALKDKTAPRLTDMKKIPGRLLPTLALLLQTGVVERGGGMLGDGRAAGGGLRQDDGKASRGEGKGVDALLPIGDMMIVIIALIPELNDFQVMRKICGLLPDSFSLVPLSGCLSGSLLCLSPDTVTVFDINEGTGDTSTARSIAIATSSCVGGDDPSKPSKGILFPGDELLSMKSHSKTSPTMTSPHEPSHPLNESMSEEKKKKKSIFEERTNLNKMLRRGYVRGGGMTHIVNSAGMLRNDLNSLPTVLFNQSELQVDLRDCLAEVLGDRCCLFILRDTGRFLMAHFVSSSSSSSSGSHRGVTDILWSFPSLSTSTPSSPSLSSPLCDLPSVFSSNPHAGLFFPSRTLSSLPLSSRFSSSLFHSSSSSSVSSVPYMIGLGGSTIAGTDVAVFLLHPARLDASRVLNRRSPLSLFMHASFSKDEEEEDEEEEEERGNILSWKILSHLSDEHQTGGEKKERQPGQAKTFSSYTPEELQILKSFSVLKGLDTMNDGDRTGENKTPNLNGETRGGIVAKVEEDQPIYTMDRKALIEITPSGDVRKCMQSAPILKVGEEQERRESHEKGGLFLYGQHPPAPSPPTYSSDHVYQHQARSIMSGQERKEEGEDLGEREKEDFDNDAIPHDPIQFLQWLRLHRDQKDERLSLLNHKTEDEADTMMMTSYTNAASSTAADTATIVEEVDQALAEFNSSQEDQEEGDRDRTHVLGPNHHSHLLHYERGTLPSSSSLSSS
ncbi:cpsf a subunit region protein, partial [Cystoisospora suis]